MAGPITLADLARSPNRLATHYTRFRVGERLLLTGHSHQAWPDVGFEGQQEAWTDAAEHVDDKWERCAERADTRHGFARLLGDRDGVVALGQNTHELVLRFLSALALRERPRLVATDGEFHTLRRQLDRLAEEPVLEIVRVSRRPAETLAARLTAAVNDRTAAVLVSSVLFETAHIVPGLDTVLVRCRSVGAELLVDAYHQVNVVPIELERLGLGDAFVVGGGYKYCQLGEGNCFLRVPPGRERMRPVLTGWYSEFESLPDRATGVVAYGEGAARWAGATYDPTSHYRAARVFDFFDAHGLTPSLLRAVSRHQIGLMVAEFDALDLDPAVITRDRTTPLEWVAGFLALDTPHAKTMAGELRARGVWTDTRGNILRLGPAPYLSDEQLRDAVAAVGDVARGM
jgi:kynureninase